MPFDIETSLRLQEELAETESLQLLILAATRQALANAQAGNPSALQELVQFTSKLLHPQKDSDSLGTPIE